MSPSPPGGLHLAPDVARLLVMVLVAGLSWAAYLFGSRPAVALRVRAALGLGPAAEPDPERRRTAVSWWRRLWGALCLGLPALATVLSRRGDAADGAFLASPSGSTAWIAAAIAAVALGAVLGLSARRPFFARDYPELRCRRWTPAIFLGNAAVWLLYLAAYELFFRGFILGGLLEVASPWLAVAVMTVVYAAAHLQKSMVETLGSLPMGVLFGFLTLSSGSIVPAIALHLATALLADLLGVITHPEMTVGAPRSSAATRAG